MIVFQQFIYLKTFSGVFMKQSISGFATPRWNISTRWICRQAWFGWSWYWWMSSCSYASLLWADIVGRSYQGSSGLQFHTLFVWNFTYKITFVVHFLRCSLVIYLDFHSWLCCLNWFKAREYLYFKLYGKQCITPVGIMTSAAKNNHERISTLLEKLKWFGRGRSKFHLFEQV